MIRMSYMTVRSKFIDRSSYKSNSSSYNSKILIKSLIIHFHHPNSFKLFLKSYLDSRLSIKQRITSLFFKVLHQGSKNINKNSTIRGAKIINFDQASPTRRKFLKFFFPKLMFSLNSIFYSFHIIWPSRFLFIILN